MMSDATALPPSDILIVDDNLQNLELLEAYLESMENVSTRRATDGEACLAAVDEKLPDLILLDIMMPKLSGYEVCKKLRAKDKTATIPVIMVTALHEMADMELATEVGANEFLTKPVNRIDLAERVTALLRARHYAGDSADNA